MIPAHYPTLVKFIGGVPKAEVRVIHSKTGITTRYVTIVDTGADHLQLEPAAAASAGLNYAALPHTSIATAGGNVTFRQAQITVELYGKQKQVTAFFGPSPAGPLLGRSTLLTLLEVGFDSTDWGYK